MINANVLTFREFMTHESLPLSSIQNAVLEFLQGRDDAVVFGAQAVNAYVAEPRMSQDIDIYSTRAAGLARELRDHLSQKFHIGVRMREVGKGRGYRLYQIQKPGNRHLVDLRPVKKMPKARRIERVLIAEPAELIASKVIAYHQRRGQPKSGTDWRDLAMLLLAFPELKRDPAPVEERLKAGGAGAEILAVWKELVSQEIQSANEDDEF